MLLNASGCLDALTAPDVARSLDGFVTKTVTPLPRAGNEPVRIAETELGMLNSIGLANPGIDRFVEEVLPRLAELGVPLWVSVGGFSVDDYAQCVARLDAHAEVSAIELNLSCPNVDAFEEPTAEIVEAARRETSKPLYAKLSPAVPDVAAVAVAARDAGADGLSLVNTIRGLALDDRTLQPRLARGAGGLSGPALKPIALAAVYACFAATRMPIVGMGGVESGRDVLDLLAAGASHVALGTVLFSDPEAAGRVRSELAAEATSRGLRDALAARGLAQSSLQMRDSSSDNRVGKHLESEQNLSLDRGGEAASIPRS
jgi:dihydroorotate dehydrogenase (NAD+) catalytic subunit